MRLGHPGSRRDQIESAHKPVEVGWRLFRMSPIHHHFELGGWPETTVIIRFWLLAAVSVALALAIFIGDFTRIAAR